MIFDEAENRLSAQMALLVYLTHKNITEPSDEVVEKHARGIDSLLSQI